MARTGGVELSRRAYLRIKRRQSRNLLEAMDAFQDGCAYLPKYSQHGGALSELREWIEGPCRKAWRKA
jgi:hypothetical protein